MYTFWEKGKLRDKSFRIPQKMKKSEYGSQNVWNITEILIRTEGYQLSCGVDNNKGMKIDKFTF